MTPVTTHNLEEVQNASPTRLIVILYDEAVIALRAAATAIEDNDIEGRCNAVERATNILAHLCSSLDLVAGREVAANLATIYEYLIGRLVQVNFRNDASIALDIANHLEMLRESWIEVDALSAKNNDSDDADSAKVALQPADRKLAASQAA
jgi:flagellar protein FliS